MVFVVSTSYTTMFSCSYHDSKHGIDTTVIQAVSVAILPSIKTIKDTGFVVTTECEDIIPRSRNLNSQNFKLKKM